MLAPVPTAVEFTQLHIFIAMPSLVKIRVGGAKNLPMGMLSLGLTDAFVALDFASTTKRTKTCPKTQNPVWNEEFRFEIVDDSVLQDFPVELKVFDDAELNDELNYYVTSCFDGETGSS